MGEDYVLRKRDKEEINRMAFQHMVWKDISDFAIEKIKLQKEDHIIDLGCGPGYVSFDMAQKLNDNGRIHCLDSSQKFLAFIQEKGDPRIECMKLDIREVSILRTNWLTRFFVSGF